MTAPPSLLDTVAALAVVDVAGLGCPDDVDSFVRRVAVVRAWTDSLLTAAAARADELATVDGAGPGGEHAVRSAARLTHRDAAAVARRTGIVVGLPIFAEAFGAGEISGDHVDVLARIVPHLSAGAWPEFAAAETDLVMVARRLAPEAFARHVRALVALVDPTETSTELEHLERQAELRLWRGRDGLIKFAGTFGPTDGPACQKAIDDETATLTATETRLPANERRPVERLRVEALTNLINGGHTARHPGRTALVVHVGLERLVGEPGGDQTCETSGGQPLPIDWVRDLAMRADIVPVLLDRDGQAVELSRTATSRLATFLQRVMLRAMYPTCVTPGCEVPFDDCDIHHLEAFNGRNTLLANLMPACKPDHRRVHHDGWSIELVRHRDITVRQPDGRVQDPYGESFPKPERPPARPPGTRPREAAA